MTAALSVGCTSHSPKTASSTSSSATTSTTVRGTTLVDGRAQLMISIAGHTDKPVFRAELIAASDPVVALCMARGGVAGDTFLTGVAGRDGMSVTARSHLATAHGEIYGCDAIKSVKTQDDWCDASAATSSKMADVVAHFYGASTSCGLDTNRQTGFLWVPVTTAAKWVLVDQGDWLEAYDAIAPLIRVSGTHTIPGSGQYTPHVLILDVNGKVLEDTTIQGRVAG